MGLVLWKDVAEKPADIQSGLIRTLLPAAATKKGRGRSPKCLEATESMGVVLNPLAVVLAKPDVVSEATNSIERSEDLPEA